MLQQKMSSIYQENKKKTETNNHNINMYNAHVNPRTNDNLNNDIINLIKLSIG